MPTALFQHSLHAPREQRRPDLLDFLNLCQSLRPCPSPRFRAPGVSFEARLLVYGFVFYGLVLQGVLLERWACYG